MGSDGVQDLRERVRVKVTRKVLAETSHYPELYGLPILVDFREVGGSIRLTLHVGRGWSSTVTVGSPGTGYAPEQAIATLVADLRRSVSDVVALDRKRGVERGIVMEERR